MVLAAGIGAIQCGAMLMALAWQNRAVGDRRQLGPAVPARRRAAGAAGGDGRHRVHPALGHAPVALLPGVVPACSSSSWSAPRARRVARWPATIGRRSSTRRSRMVMLLVAAAVPGPAAARADLRAGRSLHAAGLSAAARRAGAGDRPAHAARRAGPRARLGARRRRWPSCSSRRFVAVQWPFADFLVSPWARNDFFGSHRMDYGVPPEIQARWYQLNPPDNLAIGLADRAGGRVRLGAARPVVGQLDVAGAAMTAARVARRALAVVLLCALAVDGARRQPRHVLRRQGRPLRRPRQRAAARRDSRPRAGHGPRAPAPEAPTDYRVTRARGPVERRAERRAASGACRARARRSDALRRRALVHDRLVVPDGGRRRRDRSGPGTAIVPGHGAGHGRAADAALAGLACWRRSACFSPRVC